MGKVLATNERLIEIQENYINQLYKNKDFETCYSSCDYLLSLLPEEKTAQKKIKRFCYLRQAVCKNKLGEYEQAMEKADIAIKYCSKDDYYSIAHMKALIHMKLDDRQKALRCLNQCIKWYKLNSMHYELAMVLDAKAGLLRSEDLFEEAIKEYKAAYEEGNYYNKEMFLNEFDQTHQRLIEEVYLYIGEQHILKAVKAMNNIKNPDIKKEVKEKIMNLLRKEV